MGKKRRIKQNRLKEASSGSSSDYSEIFRRAMAGYSDTPEKEPPVVLHLTEFKVTWDPLPDTDMDALPEKVKDRLPILFEDLKKKPKKIMPELRRLHARYPDYPVLANWLIMALRSGTPTQEEEAFVLAETTFRKYPDYLFGRTTYAEFLLEQDRLDEAEELMMGPGIFFTTLYPNRDVFHVSEVRHWAYLCARIKILRGDPDTARTYRDMIDKLEPDSDVVAHLDSLLDGEFALLSKWLATKVPPH